MQASNLRIAWRNLWRSRKRTLLAVLAIAVGQWALLATQGLMRGYADNIQRAVTGPMIGHIQIHAPGYREKKALDLVIRDAPEKVKEIREVPGVEDAAARIYASVLMAPEREAFIATIVGVDVASESRPFGLLSGSETKLKSGHVMIGYRLARKSDAKIGDEIALVGSAIDGSLANDLYTVQAIIKGPVDLVNQSGVVMSLADARQFLVMPGEAHEIVIRTRHLEDVEPVLAAVRKIPALAGLEILSWKEIAPELVTIIDMTMASGWFVLIVVLIAALAGIVNTLMMATYERMHEFGMLLALGCRPGRIVRMILIEAVLLGFLGVAVGSAAGAAFVQATQKNGINMAAWGGDKTEDMAYEGLRLPLQIRPRLEPVDPLAGLAAVIVVSLVAAAWPAMTAARLDPMEAMRS